MESGAGCCAAHGAAVVGLAGVAQEQQRFHAVVEKFLDEHLDYVSDIIKWKDHKRRIAEASAQPFCKLAMSSRLLFLGLDEIREGLHYEYKSATCTVYIVDSVEDEQRT
jgi:hypothetical protein